jgi:hypothetical protein
MKKILLLLAAILILGCSTDEDEKVNCCTIIDTGVSIKYVNEDGENLFELDGGLTEADIAIYHKINNEWVKYYEGNLDYPKGFRIVEREDGTGTYLVVFPSTTIIENNYSETKIEFSKSDFDVLKTEIDRSNSNEIVTKVWYNDELKWEGNQTERMFEILK